MVLGSQAPRGRTVALLSAMVASTLPALLLAGCGAAYSTLQPGEVSPKGTFRAQLGVGAGLNPGQVGDVYDAGESAATAVEKYVSSADRQACEGGSDRSRCVTADDLRPLVESVMMQATAPLATFDLLAGLRYGLLQNMDLGLRAGVAGWMADLRYQFLGEADADPEARGFDGSIGLGFSRRTFEYPSYLGDVADMLGLADNYRWDIRVPALFSYRFGPWGYVYWGAGYMLSRWHLDVDPEFAYIDALPDGSAATTAAELEQSFRDATSGALEGTDTAGWIQQFTAVGGALLGYRWIYLGLELNVIYYRMATDVLHTTVAHNGLILYPAATVMGQF